MIIATANSKGGVGKTTIAVHLAGWLNLHGYQVALADCDPQQSSSEWLSEAVPEIKVFTFNDPSDVLSGLNSLHEHYQVVIADGPAGLAELSRCILLRADAVLVPCKASTLEARALALATKIVRECQDCRANRLMAAAVLTMVNDRFVLTREMLEAAQLLDLPVAKSRIRQRQIYAKAPGVGKLLWQLGREAKEAALELDLLFQELFPEACEDDPGKVAAMFKVPRGHKSGGERLTKEKRVVNAA